jgi:hypothetical protein
MGGLMSIAKLARACAWHSQFVDGALANVLRDAADALDERSSDDAFDVEVYHELQALNQMFA